MPLVAGVDSSTQSCKVVIADAETGEVRRSGSAAHPDATEVSPALWEKALEAAVEAAGGLDDVSAIAVGAQQHGMVCLDGDGAVVRDALLWNDTRSASAAVELIAELPGGAAQWARDVGSVPLASFTITKLRWLAEHEPVNAARTEAVCLPHDWLSWRLRRSSDLSELRTDRGDASGTGYWSPAEARYRPDLLARALGHDAHTPQVLAPSAVAGTTPSGQLVAAGTGDNAAAALGLGATEGDVVVSIGTSGVVCAVSAIPTSDASGTIAGFADATGLFLPLVCTLNAARVLEATARLLGVDLDELSRLALSAPAGADGLVMVPYFEGERTPNRPDATAAMHGMRLANTTPAHLARAAVEGLLCGLADGLDALRADGIVTRRVLLVGGGSRSEAIRRIAPALLELPVLVPAPDEYVATGAARQAAWALSGSDVAPLWSTHSSALFEAAPQGVVRARYREAQALVLDNKIR